MSSDPRRLSRDDLYKIAVNQKVIIVCLLVYVLAVVGQFAIPEEFRLFLGIGVLCLGLVATVFVFLLSLKVYSQGTGILLGILTLVPCVGLIVLLVINQKATSILTYRGYSVGLLGADLSQFEEGREPRRRDDDRDDDRGRYRDDDPYDRPDDERGRRRDERPRARDDDERFRSRDDDRA